MPEYNQANWHSICQIDPREPFHVQNKPAIGGEHLINNYANNENKTVLVVLTGHTYQLTSMCLGFTSTGTGYCYTYIADATPIIKFYGGSGERSNYGEFCTNVNIICPITLLEGYTVHVVSSNTYITARLALQYFDDTP